MVNDKFERYVDDNIDAFARDIIRLASQRSVSARNEGIEECATLVESMLKEIGAETKMLRVDGAPPLVFGELKAKKPGKTVMFYNHYDVQPEEPLELWKSPPFKPETREGAIYGRGVSDDKGELVARLKIAEAYVKTQGGPPCDLKFFFEGEEETGSVHLGEYIEKYGDLFNADAVIWEYGTVDTGGTPKVTLGVKGIIYLELVIRSLSQDAHSSLAAALPSAPWRMVKLLNTLKDENERITVPGWYDDVSTLSEDELQVLQMMPFDGRGLRSGYGAAGFVGGMTDDQAKKALVQRPTGNIAGIWAGYTGPGSKTVLPKEIHVKMDFRLVPEQDPDDLLKKLRKHLDGNGFSDVEVKVESMEPAARTSYKHPFAQAAIAAAEHVYGKRPIVQLGSPGTGPLYLFTRKYNMPSVDIGVSGEDGGIHAPNENLKLENLRRGILWIAETIERFVAS
ncbi:MAG: M20/M25/M40 family metallo-hydrolase [Nitrososphaerota archaeon]|nr:M20/M25/M40 family metallo-hydrolase [Nitrososphaerota archaeon]MDG7025474.1 M20/M25/M40 family metallo-hydrolase [Nitrososphaerota archaeon]